MTHQSIAFWLALRLAFLIAQSLNQAFHQSLAESISSGWLQSITPSLNGFINQFHIIRLLAFIIAQSMLPSINCSLNPSIYAWVALQMRVKFALHIPKRYVK